MIDRWTKDEILTMQSESPKHDGKDKGSGALSLDHLQSAFYLYFLGTGFAIIVLCFEFTFDYLCRKTN